MTAATVLSCAYGYEVTTPDDHMLRTIEKTALHLGRAVRPASKSLCARYQYNFNVFLEFFVNILPWLNIFPVWFPGASWKKVVKEWRQELRQTIDLPYDFTQNQIVSLTKSVPKFR